MSAVSHYTRSISDATTEGVLIVCICLPQGGWQTVFKVCGAVCKSLVSNAIENDRECFFNVRAYLNTISK